MFFQVGSKLQKQSYGISLSLDYSDEILAILCMTLHGGFVIPSHYAPEPLYGLILDLPDPFAGNTKLLADSVKGLGILSV